MVIILAFVTLLLVQVTMENSISPRISRGQNAAEGQFLFMASIQLIDRHTTLYIHVCAGLVIDNKWILSSAICVLKTLGVSTARVKIYMYYTQKDKETVNSFAIKKIIPHERFDRLAPTLPYNIGLLKIDPGITYPIRAILHHPRSSVTGALWIIGWGRTSAADSDNIPEVLQYAGVHILENQECQAAVGEFLQLTDSHMCTYVPRRSITMCEGDSGGPVISFKNNVPEVVGILSWTLNPCGQIGSPTVSTRVSVFHSWASEKMRKIPNQISETDSLLTPLLVEP